MQKQRDTRNHKKKAKRRNEFERVITRRQSCKAFATTIQGRATFDNEDHIVSPQHPGIPT